MSSSWQPAWPVPDTVTSSHQRPLLNHTHRAFGHHSTQLEEHRCSQTTTTTFTTIYARNAETSCLPSATFNHSVAMYPVTHGATFSTDKYVQYICYVGDRLTRIPQALNKNPSILVGLSADQSSAPVGINPVCGIPLVGQDGSLANIANVIACALSMLVVALLILRTGRRKAAVGEFSLSLHISSPVPFFLLVPFNPAHWRSSHNDLPQMSLGLANSSLGLERDTFLLACLVL